MFKDAFASFRALIFLLPLLHATRYSESSCYGGENADDNLYQRFPCFSFHHDFPFFLVVKYLCFFLVVKYLYFVFKSSVGNLRFRFLEDFSERA